MWQSSSFKSIQPSVAMCHYPIKQKSANEVMSRRHHLLPSNPRHLHPTAATVSRTAKGGRRV